MQPSEVDRVAESDVVVWDFTDITTLDTGEAVTVQNTVVAWLTPAAADPDAALCFEQLTPIVSRGVERV